MKALTVRPTSWHYRLYRWWLGLAMAKERPLDLCRYMRCLVVWLPLTLLLFGAFWGGYYALSPIWWPLSRRRSRVTLGRVATRVEAWGETPKAKRFGRGLERLFGVAMCVAVLAFFASVFYSSWIAGVCVVGGIVLVFGAALLVAWQVEYFSLVWAWIVAKKRRVCPLITVR